MGFIEVITTLESVGNNKQEVAVKVEPHLGLSMRAQILLPAARDFSSC